MEKRKKFSVTVRLLPGHVGGSFMKEVVNTDNPLIVWKVFGDQLVKAGKAFKVEMYEWVDGVGFERYAVCVDDRPIRNSMGDGLWGTCYGDGLAISSMEEFLKYIV